MTITPEEIARLRALEAGRCDPRLSHEFRAAMAFPALPRLLDEIERLRADLREAMELLRWASPDMGHASWDEWGGRANLLLAKHKETP